jgi:hypothetical protein
VIDMPLPLTPSPSVTVPAANRPDVTAKINNGVTDAREFFEYVPILNLILNPKQLTAFFRKITSNIFRASTLISLGLFILKCAAGLAILSGPVGWAISIGIFAFCAIAMGVIIRKSQSNVLSTWNSVGYQCKETKLKPKFQGDDIINHDIHIQDHEETIYSCLDLCDQNIWKAENNRTEQSDGKAEMSEIHERLKELNFQPPKLYSDGNGNRLWTFSRENSSLSFQVLQIGGKVFFHPHIDTNSVQGFLVQGRTQLDNVAGFSRGRTDEIFEAAFQETMRALGPDVIVTGSGADGTYAQFLALKYGNPAYCFNAYGIGATLQSVIGYDRLARNAKNVFNFTSPKFLSIAQRIAAKIENPLAVALAYRAPGVFARQFRVDDTNHKTATDAIRNGVRETAAWERKNADTLENLPIPNEHYVHV